MNMSGSKWIIQKATMDDELTGEAKNEEERAATAIQVRFFPAV